MPARERLGPGQYLCLVDVAFRRCFLGVAVVILFVALPVVKLSRLNRFSVRVSQTSGIAVPRVTWCRS